MYWEYVFSLTLVLSLIIKTNHLRLRRGLDQLSLRFFQTQAKKRVKKPMSPVSWGGESTKIIPTVSGHGYNRGKGKTWTKQTHLGCRHPDSRTVDTECGGVNARASKTRINVWGFSIPYSAQSVVWSEMGETVCHISPWMMTCRKELKKNSEKNENSLLQSFPHSRTAGQQPGGGVVEDTRTWVMDPDRKKEVQWKIGF